MIKFILILLAVIVLVSIFLKYFRQLIIIVIGADIIYFIFHSHFLYNKTYLIFTLMALLLLYEVVYSLRKYVIVRSLYFITFISLLVYGEVIFHHNAIIYWGEAFLSFCFFCAFLLTFPEEKGFDFRKVKEGSDILVRILFCSYVVTYPIYFTHFDSGYFLLNLCLFVPFVAYKINLFPYLFSHQFYNLEQEELEEKDYTSFLGVWNKIASEMQDTEIKAEINALLKIVINYQNPRDIAKNFFSYGVRWGQGTYFEELFRSGWKNILRGYKKGDNIDFSWKCLGDISSFMVQFFLQYQEGLKQEQNQKRTYRQSRQNYKKQRARPSRAKRAWYEVLGVFEGASFDEIRKAYRKKMMVYHPDRCAQLSEDKRIEAEEMAKEVNAAFEEVKSLRG